MTTLTREEVLQWCTKQELVLDRSSFVHFSSNERVLRLAFPKLIYRAPVLTNFLYGLLQDGSPFKSLLFWVKQIGIWGDRWDAIGIRQLALERKAKGDERNLYDAPGHIFSAEEELDTIGVSVLPMIYGWDAYLIPDSAEMFVYISHDEYVEIGFKNPALESTLMEQCQEWIPVMKLDKLVPAPPDLLEQEIQGQEEQKASGREPKSRSSMGSGSRSAVDSAGSAWRSGVPIELN
jgi:hypothetical protein